MHALNGNVRPGRSDCGWTPVGGRLDGRLLTEPQQVGRLRATGWIVPPTIPDPYILRVYDTRLDPKYLRDLATEVAPIDMESRIIGGDFLCSTDLEDGPAFRPPPLKRWGPDGRDSYHLFIPPRPHLSHWLQRCLHQLSVEAAHTHFSVCCVVQRSACPATFDVPSLRRLIPQAEAIFQGPTLVTRVLAVGERPPPIRRIPATCMTLPPVDWEAAQLPRSNVLLILQFHRHSGPPVLPSGEWIRGQAPPPPASDLELLRLELILPPSTKIGSAERFVHGILEKIARAMEVPSPSPVSFVTCEWIRAFFF